VNWGILATGSIAASFAQDLQLHGHKIVAVGSRRAESAARFAQRFGIARAYGSYEALVADPDVEAIYVATPHTMHAVNAKLALNHGKHVLIEKPFTINADEAAEVIGLAAERNLIVMEAMWTRFLPHMLRVREIIASGVLGTIRSIVVDHTQDITDDPEHRLNALSLGGGALLDLGIYPVSFIWDVLGAPDSVVASAVFKSTGADAQVAALFRYGNQAIAAALAGSDSAGRNIATIHGTAGRIEIDAVWYSPTSFRRYDEAEKLVESYRSEVTGRGMQYQAAEFERRVREGVTPQTILPPSETFAIMRCLDSIRAQIGLRYPGERGGA
jgi:predicted dehydrogenase